jgi:hypothetical protein
MIVRYKYFALNCTLLSTLGIQGMETPDKPQKVYLGDQKFHLIIDPHTKKHVLKAAIPKHVLNPKDLFFCHNPKTSIWIELEQKSFLQLAPTGIALAGVPLMVTAFFHFLKEKDIVGSAVTAFLAITAAALGAFGAQNHRTNANMLSVGGIIVTSLLGAFAARGTVTLTQSPMQSTVPPTISTMPTIAASMPPIVQKN